MTVERVGEGAGGRRRRPMERGRVRWVVGDGGVGDRIWQGGIAIEMEGDRDRVSMKFKNIHDIKKCP